MRDTTPALPTELQVEITGSCNLACPMCLVRYRPALNRAQGSMPFELFRRVADALPDLQVITLQGLGEPLLAPALFDMVEYASGRHARMGFNTNGTLLTREVSERLVRAGLAWLHVSLDGATAATYEGIRDGASYDRVRRNVADLVDVKRRLGTESPRLSLVLVAMRRNIGELPDVVRLAASWGVEQLWVQNLSHSFADTDPSGSYQEIRRFAEEQALWSGEGLEAAGLFGEAAVLADELGLRLRLPRLPGAGPPGPAEPAVPHRPPGCDWPWRSAYITHRGRVQPCCMVMGSDRLYLGDLAEQEFPVIWSGAPYQAFRAGLLDGKPNPVCQGCSVYRGTF
jgi:radical SAM protein with 4Fe4S-binding SPASM domain